MNLNPLENQECLYNIEDMFKLENHNYDWDSDYVSIEADKELKDKLGCDYGNYDYLLKSITDKIDWFLKAGDKDYQGSIYYLGKDAESRYYFLDQGYGSCSGCDAYQSSEWNCECNNTLKPLEELRESVKRAIKQFNSLDEFKSYINGENSKGSFYWYDNDFEDFINKLNEKFKWNLEILSD